MNGSLSTRSIAGSTLTAWLTRHASTAQAKRIAQVFAWTEKATRSAGLLRRVGARDRGRGPAAPSGPRHAGTDTGTATRQARARQAPPRPRPRRATAVRRLAARVGRHP